VPAPALALGVAAGVVLVYAALVGRERTADEGSNPRAEAASLRLGGVVTVAAGLRSLVRGTRAYLAGVADALRNPVAASKRPWDPRSAALGITALAVVWFAQVSIVGVTGPEARWAGLFLERVGVDAGAYEYWGSVLFQGDGVRLTVDMTMIAAVVVGAFLAALWSGDFSVRVPKRRRVPNAVGGGFLMGAGSRLAPGCNIGNIYSGLAELSVHSFVATVGIVAGVYAMTHWMYRDVGCAI
jgi:hypothetical protein